MVDVLAVASVDKPHLSSFNCPRLWKILYDLHFFPCQPGVIRTIQSSEEL